MSVYVDSMQVTIPNKKWPYNTGCHLTADTKKELHVFAVNILHLKKNWFQDHPRHPHYDLTLGKRRAAILNEAIEI